MAISRKDFEKELKKSMPEINKAFREAYKDYVPGEDVYLDRLLTVALYTILKKEDDEQGGTA